MTLPPDLGLYEGVVTHVRRQPKTHRLRYRMFMMLFDIDRLDAAAARLKPFSHNRFNWLSFYDRDHGDGQDLRGFAETHLAAAGLDPDGGPIRILCMPRILGYVFNPISVWFCWRRDGRLSAILYEVNNTFGQRHSYLIPVPSAAGATLEQACDKAFFVSPFMDMDLHYRFRILPPGEAAVVDIAVTKAGAPMLDARFAGQAQSVSDRSLQGLLRRYPLMTLMVVAGIHWEALKIVAKGIWLRPRPPLPPSPVTYVVETAAGG